MTNFWVVSIFWLLWIMLLWTYMYKCFWGHKFLNLLGINLRMELLSHMVILHLNFWRKAKLFSKLVVLFLILTKTSYFLFFFNSHPIGCEVYLILTLICILLMTNDVKHLCMGIFPICIFYLGKYLFRFIAHF